MVKCRMRRQQAHRKFVRNASLLFGEYETSVQIGHPSARCGAQATTARGSAAAGGMNTLLTSAAYMGSGAARRSSFGGLCPSRITGAMKLDKIKEGEYRSRRRGQAVRARAAAAGGGEQADEKATELVSATSTSVPGEISPVRL